MTPKKVAEEATIDLPAIQIDTFDLRLVGDSPLLCNRFGEKAKQAILDKQMKKAATARRAKDPEADFQSALYPFPSEFGDYGFPSVGFKKAAVGAARWLSGAKMTELRGAFQVMGVLTPLEGEPKMREDVVGGYGRGADIRYRAEFPDWVAHLSIQMNASAFSAEQVINLFNVGGFSSGVGDWRPEKSGTFGTFHVG